MISTCGHLGMASGTRSDLGGTSCLACLTAAEALNSSDGSAQEVVAKVLTRITLFGSLPPSILPMLVSVRVKVDLPKTADRKLLRVVNYLIQLASGEGSAGTVVPFSTLIGGLMAQTSAARSGLHNSCTDSILYYRRGCMHLGSSLRTDTCCCIHQLLIG